MKLLKYIPYIIFFLVSSSFGQKQTEKIIDANNIKQVNIDGKGIFTVTIKSVKSSEITLKTIFEGEYQNNLVAITKIENNTLFVAVKFQPFFKMPNDKLSAHKVLANDLILEVPEHLSVVIKSGISRVTASGNFKNFEANLHSGSCSLFNFEGDATIKTIEGNITITTTAAIIEATSLNGTIEKATIPTQKNRLQLTSVNGNISILKAEK